MSRNAAPQKDPETGTWWFVVDLPPGGDGRRRQAKRRGFRTKAEAQAELAWPLLGGCAAWATLRDTRSQLVLGLCRHGALHIAVRDNIENDEIIVETAYRPDPALWEPGFKTRRMSQ